MIPVTTLAALPIPRAGYERQRLEVKVNASAYRAKVGPETKWKRVELAKDIVAMANATGGTLLVGISESAGVIGELLGIPSADADELAAQVDDVIQHCAPKPEVECQKIPLRDDLVVLAVNIWPCVAAPVGVSMRLKDNDAESPTKKLDDAWLFPVRRGSHSRPISPEQFGTLEFMSGRKVTAMLAAIPMTERDQVRLSVALLNGGRFSQDALFADLVSFDLGLNVAHFKVNPARDSAALPLVVPLDWIASVWRNSTERRWDVALSCRIKKDAQRYVPLSRDE